jgi:hypothetical protein
LPRITARREEVPIAEASAERTAASSNARSADRADEGLAGLHYDDVATVEEEVLFVRRIQAREMVRITLRVRPSRTKNRVSSFAVAAPFLRAGSNSIEVRTRSRL